MTALACRPGVPAGPQVFSPVRDYRPVVVLEREPGTGRPLAVRFASRQRAEFMRTRVDCLRCALATLASLPYGDVPCLGSPEAGTVAHTQAIADLGAWARARGWRLTYHTGPCWTRPAWIGGIPADQWGPSHAVVMCSRRIVHDPASNFPLPIGQELVPVALQDIKFGITLDRLEAP